MKLYGISGLGADKRVFEFLTLEYTLFPIEWIEPLKNETIEDYSLRFSKLINTEENFGILGVSFGGLIAVEISKILKPKLTILISSVETKKELRKIYRIIGKTKIFKIIPESLFDPPRIVANWVFGAKNRSLLNQILNDTDQSFAKWAINELMNWKNDEKISTPVLKIGGTNDLLLPSHKGENQELINKGTHFMIVDKADEISQIINREIKILTAKTK
ncbi:MAG: alpha/beta hydrolase [Flavobacteriales bacterium]|jgi:pimeloyl-ACP methyl ester carboxylesterase|nr:alpha/beta hydrolase [Flavobacteriales bacterium]